MNPALVFGLVAGGSGLLMVGVARLVDVFSRIEDALYVEDEPRGCRVPNCMGCRQAAKR